MIVHLAFAGFVLLLGLAVCLPVARRLGFGIAGFLAYPVGLLAFVSVALLWAALPETRSPLSLAALLVGVMLAASVRLRGLRMKGIEARALVVSLAMMLVGATLAVWLGHATYTLDSHVLIANGRYLMNEGVLFADMDLSNRGAFMMAVQGVGVHLGVGYLPEVAPLLALSYAGCFVLLFERLAGSLPGARGWGLFACVAFMSPYFLLVHAFYLHTNLAAGVYLFLAVAGLHLGEREAEPAWLLVAFLCLLGFSLQRVEAAAVALCVLSIAAARSDLPDRVWAWHLVPFWLGLVLWYAEIERLAGPQAALLTPARARLAIFGLVGWGLGVWVLSLPTLAAVRARVPGMVMAMLGAVVVLAMTLRADRVLPSIEALGHNVIGLHWGGLFIAFVVLGVALFLLLAPTDRRTPLALSGRGLFLVAALVQLAWLVGLSAMRRFPYHDGWHDSGNRMLVHLVPLVSFWLLASYGPALVKGFGDQGPSN